MPQELIGLVLVIAAIIVFFALRRGSEIAAPEPPPSKPVTEEPPSQIAVGQSRVLITHPMIRQAAERALSKGGEAAKYIVREEDQIFFSFDGIPIPEDREKALDLIKRIQAGQNADISDLLWFVRRIIKA